MSGSAACPHASLHFDINHSWSGDTNLRYLEIKARCNGCGARMIFRGMPCGLSPEQPTADLEGYEARLPMIAEGEPLRGKPIGFMIRQSG